MSHPFQIRRISVSGGLEKSVMRMTPLGREIGVALVVKLMALVALYVLFFSPAHRVRVTPAEMAEALSAGAAAR
jgi:uncharacterized protein (DUF58 family)